MLMFRSRRTKDMLLTVRGTVYTHIIIQRSNFLSYKLMTFLLLSAHFVKHEHFTFSHTVRQFNRGTFTSTAHRSVQLCVSNNRKNCCQQRRPDHTKLLTVVQIWLPGATGQALVSDPAA